MSVDARVFVLLSVVASVSCSTEAEPRHAPVPHCLAQCVTEADCGSGNDLDTSENYKCVDGACHYRGCQSHAECAGFGVDYVCAPSPYVGVSGCVRACVTVDDCTSSDQLLHDADNYECVDGACQHRGCNDNAECASQFGAGSVCLQGADGVSAECVEYCETAADCVPPDSKAAWNEDNFRCVANYCLYQGCRHDTECAMTIADSICVEP